MGKELFDNIPSKVADLLSDVKNGRIGLPDLQRPFVWKDNKVRELLDSMMKRNCISHRLRRSVDWMSVRTLNCLNQRMQDSHSVHQRRKIQLCWRLDILVSYRLWISSIMC